MFQIKQLIRESSIVNPHLARLIFVMSNILIVGYGSHTKEEYCQLWIQLMI